MVSTSVCSGTGLDFNCPSSKAGGDEVGVGDVVVLSGDGKPPASLAVAVPTDK